MWEFWRRHKRKVYVTLGVFGSGFLLYKLYDSHKQHLIDLEKELASERENEELVKAQMKVHFENIQKIADTTTLPHAMVYLSGRVEERMDILHLTEKLMKGKGQQSTLTSLEKLELWNRLKVQSFAKTVLSIWSMTALSLYIRVQVNILGRHLYIDTARGLGAAHLLDESELIDRNDQQQFLAGVDFLSNYGMSMLISNMQTSATEVLKEKQLKDLFTTSVLHDTIMQILDVFMSMGSPHQWVNYLMPEDLKYKSAAFSSNNCQNERTKFDLLMLEAHAVLSSHGLSRESFPKGFLFGTATSAYQVEGMASKEGRGPSIWDVFIKTPGLEPNNATGEISVDQYHRYKEDIDLMKNLNFDAYRFSISWSRIFPNGTGKVNQKGVAYYNRLIDYMLKRGITPYANLNHYDLPQALQEKYNGWLGREVVNDFADYADFCFKTFGDRVKNWMTFNEPRVVAALGYDTGFFAPGRCSKTYGNCTAGNSATEPYIVAHNLILCHASAVQRYRTKYQKIQKGRIGILLDFVWYEPLTRSKADNHAAQRARDFHVGWFLHPIVYGEYPKTMQNILGRRLPKFTKEEVDMVKGSFDVVGINQYTAYYIYNPNPANKPKELSYQQDWNAGFAYARQGVPIGPTAYSEWLYKVPWGLYKAITYVKERYGNPTMILAENGMDDPGNMTIPEALHDKSRIDYYKAYLKELKKTVDEGANVQGYFAWSLLDNFEWRLGYTSRFGIVYVDFKTLKRTPKMSAHWFQKMLSRKKE